MHVDSRIYIKGSAIIRAVFKNNDNSKPVAWYRCYNRNLKKVIELFLDHPNFYYAKIYDYNKKTKKVGFKRGWFNREKFMIY